MARKQTKRDIPPGSPILKLDNVPGPEAKVDELATHYMRVQKIMAIHRYDDVIAACHWCCDMEAGLAYSKPEEPRGTRMFCSGRCASAFGAHRAKVGGQRPKPSSSEGEEDATLPTDEETATEEETPVVKKRGSATKATPTEEPAKEPDEEPDEAAPSESPPAWKPKGQRTAKPRKQRAKKPERSDGMCAKGLHKMTPENTYEYKGTVWCRECRKASRAKSKNGNGKAKK